MDKQAYTYKEHENKYTYAHKYISGKQVHEIHTHMNINTETIW